MTVMEEKKKTEIYGSKNLEADIQISYRQITNYWEGGFPKILRNFQSGSW